MSEFNIGEIAVVRWVDSRGCHQNWENLDDMESTTCDMISVGFVKTRDDDKIHLVPHFGANPPQGCGDMTIPMVSVKSVDMMTIPKTTRKAGKPKPGHAQ